MRALVYTRASVDRTGDELSVSRQREDARALAERRGWTIVGEHADNDISAAGKANRPGFEALLADVAAGRADVVIAWALDRLTRNRRDTLRLIETLEPAAALLALVRGSDIDMSTPSGRLVADLLAATARAEIDVKSDRQRRAQEQAAQQGRRVGGRRPFGYDDDGVSVRAREAQAIRDGYDAILTGMSLARVSVDWNRRGLTTGQTGWKGERRGVPSPWRPSSVRAVLLNPRNAGLRRYKGEIVGHAAWPALVGEDTYAAAVAILSDPGRVNPPGAGRALLTGLAACQCGATVHGGRTAKGARTYRCSASYGHVSRSAEPVDHFVSRLVTARLERPDAAELLTDRDRPDVDQLRTDAQAIRARLEGLAVDFAEGELTPSQMRTATKRLRERLAEAELRMADAGRVSILGPLVTGDAKRVWSTLDVDRQRAVIDALMSVTILPPGRGTRTFRPESVQIEWKQP